MYVICPNIFEILKVLKLKKNKNIFILYCIILYCIEEAWIHAYTDGSATDAITSGGAGNLNKYPGGYFDTNSSPTGKHCTNIKAEMDALMQATTMVCDTEDTSEQVVFFTDALSVLQVQALENGKCPTFLKPCKMYAGSGKQSTVDSGPLRHPREQEG